MHPPIVKKYVHFICTALLFESVSCDNLALEASKNDTQLNSEIGCTAACMERNVTAVRILAK